MEVTLSSGYRYSTLTKDVNNNINATPCNLIAETWDCCFSDFRPRRGPAVVNNVMVGIGVDSTSIAKRRP